jgi:hypothetical protein
LFAALSGGLTLLRNEASLFLALSGAELKEFCQAFVKGAVVGDAVAQVESHLRWLFAERQIPVEAHILQAKGALGEPEVLRHSFDKERFGLGGGLVLGTEVHHERSEIVEIFPVEDQELVAGQAVADGVLAGADLAFGGFRAGGKLGVASVAFRAGGGEFRFASFFGFPLSIPPARKREEFGEGFRAIGCDSKQFGEGFCPVRLFGGEGRKSSAVRGLAGVVFFAAALFTEFFAESWHKF